MDEADFQSEPDARKAISERLFELIENAGEVMREWGGAFPNAQTADQVVGDRASSLLPSYVDHEDTSRLVRLLDHPSECAQNNVLYTLVYLIGSSDALRLAVAAADSGQVSPGTAEFARKNVDDPMMLWAYIPNLNQMVPTEQGQSPA